jgi:hypothetical protein
MDAHAAPSPNGANGARPGPDVSHGPGSVANGSGSGRDSNGRFAAGNRGGPGNPDARRVAALRTALLDAVTADDVGALARALLERAKAGDVSAAKLMLAYTVGQPLAAGEPDRLEEHEWSVEGKRPTAAQWSYQRKCRAEAEVRAKQLALVG